VPSSVTSLKIRYHQSNGRLVNTLHKHWGSFSLGIKLCWVFTDLRLCISYWKNWCSNKSKMSAESLAENHIRQNHSWQKLPANVKQVRGISRPSPAITSVYNEIVVSLAFRVLVIPKEPSSTFFLRKNVRTWMFSWFVIEVSYCCLYFLWFHAFLIFTL